ncbi:MAG TPA: amidohydrolase [Feifaniaceae bacterium]|nr:amidohydrolase [Feifaniaceae bacterium]
MLLSHADALLYEADSGFSVLRDAYIGIIGDTIRCIGADRPKEEYGAEKDLSGKLVMPGLYNAHTHTPMTLLRGVGSGLPLDRWLNEAVFPVEGRLTAEDIRAGTRLALMELLASGVVSFSDMYYQTEITAEEVLSCGVKANLNSPILGFDPDEPYESSGRIKQSLAFFREFHGAGNGRLAADFAIHAEYTNNAAHVRRYAEDCLTAGARMHLHLSETRKEHEACKEKYGKTPAEWFAALGAFDCPASAAHCVWAEDGDIAIFKEKGVSCVHNPSSNMKLGSGFMPVRKLLAAGVNVALGTDGAASNNNLNLFEEMHLASLIHKGRALDSTALPPADVLLMATRNGALSQGREYCGLLKEGYRADLIAIDMQRPHLVPALDIPALLVYSAQASDVVLTMADGKILYENGRYMTLDAERTIYDAKKAAERLYGGR